ncbi:hypothetical protein FD41_GL000187 [Lentilactobacillus farraginis DSM 18382 = JCM 14108]|uniref:Uncharacterized protein n=1 Tax=Lentilactobacillus farraginis DSM 18382 = JCM 14108 TaxID=1423743 RepID=X0P9X9_9LACO|nr:hypothetical protein FD41_GL000187 [Lentilactobacillus farraginis DSM 18382 = JCM 14108]GAF35863.1 hypothetical protein JCM14108_793 [Lentilactobacillus farraginis DSM 18382 = JCM 14108]
MAIKIAVKLVVAALLIFSTTWYKFPSQIIMYLTVTLLNIIAIFLIVSALVEIVNGYIRRKKL